jgi:hypothetical protein
MPKATSGGATPSLKQQIGNSASLLEALEAASKWSAFLLLSATFILAVVSLALFGGITTFFAQRSQGLAAFSGLITFLVVTAVAMVGVNAAGMLLSDDVWGRRQRTVMDAILASAFSCHRLIAVFFIEFLLFLGFLLVLAFLLFLCKIPGIGPILFAIVFPVGSVAAGLVFFSLIYIAIPLASPAVWNGATVKHTLLMLQAVARKRLLTVVVMMVLLGLLTLFAVGFVWGILVFGISTVLSLSAAVLGVSAGGLSGIMVMFTGGGASGYAYATGFGGALLLLVGANPGLLIALKGTSIIYREVTAGLSLEEDEMALNRRIDEIKVRAEQVRQQANAAAQHSASATRSAVASVTLPRAGTCQACNSPTTPDDIFCGVCGHRLK